MSIRQFPQAYSQDDIGAMILGTYAFSLPLMSTYASRTARDRGIFHGWLELTRLAVEANLISRHKLGGMTIKRHWEVLQEIVDRFDWSPESYYETKTSWLTTAHRGSQLLFDGNTTLASLDGLSMSHRQIIGCFAAYLVQVSSTGGWRADQEKKGLFLHTSDLVALTHWLNTEYAIQLGYRSTRLQLPPLPQEFDYRLYDVGSILVENGLALWTATSSSKGYHPEYLLYIPDSVRGSAKHEAAKGRLPKVPSPEQGALNIFENNLQPSAYKERDIQRSLENNPDLLEAGLTWYSPGRPSEFKTDVGRIDLLGRGTDQAVVVIEIKKGGADAQVVGQIQKYMAWVEKHLAHEDPVRGIIVAQSTGLGLEEAIDGSRFKINVVTFGDLPPTAGNTRYYGKCGKALPRTDSFCGSCGHEQQWLGS